MKRILLIMMASVVLASCNPTPHNRAIEFEGIPNARDLGGLKGAGGRTIKSGVLLRSADLSAATEQDIALLEERYAISSVFDFRSSLERTSRPDREIPGASYYWLSTTPEQVLSGKGGGLEQKISDINAIIVQIAFTDQGKQIARGLYPAIIADSSAQKNYGKFLHGLLQAPNGALWHCTQGKDRCGLGTAFVLTALGVDRETIIADFDLSNTNYAHDVDSLSNLVIAQGGTDAEVDVIRALIGVNTTFFGRALDDIDQRYGSLENYMDSCLGFSPQDCALLQKKYLE